MRWPPGKAVMFTIRPGGGTVKYLADSEHAVIDVAGGSVETMHVNSLLSLPLHITMAPTPQTVKLTFADLSPTAQADAVAASSVFVCTELQRSQVKFTVSHEP